MYMLICTCIFIYIYMYVCISTQIWMYEFVWGVCVCVRVHTSTYTSLLYLLYVKILNGRKTTVSVSCMIYSVTRLHDSHVFPVVCHRLTFQLEHSVSLSSVPLLYWWWVIAHPLKSSHRGSGFSTTCVCKCGWKPWGIHWGIHTLTCTNTHGFTCTQKHVTVNTTAYTPKESVPVCD